MLPWIYLFFAAIFEITFVLSMKASEGFTKPIPSIVTVLATIFGIGLLGLAMKSIPASVAYPIWTGLGTMGTVVFAVYMFGEELSLIKIISIVLILAGVVGLKISTDL